MDHNHTDKYISRLVYGICIVITTPLLLSDYRSRMSIPSYKELFFDFSRKYTFARTVYPTIFFVGLFLIAVSTIKLYEHNQRNYKK